MKKLFTFAIALCACATMLAGNVYSVDFTSGLNNWEIQNKQKPDALSYVWKQDNTYGMKASAYSKGAYATESWVVSPAIDLTSVTSAKLKVNQAANKGVTTNLAIKVSTDNGVNWTKLGINMPEGNSWTFQDDEVSLDSYAGQSIKLALVYISTTSACPTWEVKTLSISDGGSDTTMVNNLDGLEIDYYPSYSSEGAYDYTFLLYNSKDDDYLPMVAFDIYTAKEKSYTGTYSMKNGSLTEYSYYLYGSGDEDYLYMTDGEVTITDNGNSNYTLKGWFTDGNEVYGVNVTLDGEYFNSEYPYEPEEKDTLNLTVTEGEEDTQYASDYGVIEIYLTTAEGEVSLEYIMRSTDTYTSIPDGTYNIEASEYDAEGTQKEKSYNYFEAGSYYSSLGIAVGSSYQTEDAIYYLVGGTVTIATTAEGKQITLAGKTYYGSSINATYTIIGTGVEDVNATDVEASKNATKFIRNGQLILKANNREYNALGAQL